MFLAVLVTIAALTGGSLPSLAQEESEGKFPTLRVLTYNIHPGRGTDGKFDYERLTKTIADRKPDVIALRKWTTKLREREVIPMIDASHSLSH